MGDWVQLLNTTCTPTIDGIHKVTKVGDPKMFYIDEYIEKCGNAVSVMPLVTTRFATQIQRDGSNNTIGAEQKYNWNIPKLASTFLSKSYSISGTYVYTKSNISGYDFVRSTLTRPTNKDVDSVVIYNHTDNQAKVQLEVWDPMRKIIPGIAQQNLDYINFSEGDIFESEINEFNKFKLISKFSPMPRSASTKSSCWLYSIKMSSRRDAKSLIKYLKHKNIESRLFWENLSSQKPYKSYTTISNKVSSNLSGRVVTLPCSTSLTEKDQKTVIMEILNWVKKN